MDSFKHLLIVDDDTEICDLLHDFFTKRGFRVSVACDGTEMRKILHQWDIDMVILDLMLPGDDGLALCQEIRDHSELPIIMLTAVTGEADRIVGLEVGADDYMEKPFNPRELLARVKAILRRSGNAQDAAEPVAEMSTLRRYRFAGWTLHEGKRELRSPDNVIVHLSSGEFELLLAFLNQPQTVLSRDDLLNATRGVEAIPFDRSIDIQISRLRKKLAPGTSQHSLIKTVRGQGYIFTETVKAG